MASIELDRSGWPVLVARFPAEPIDDAELRRYLEELGDVAARGDRFATITDVRAMTMPLTAGQRWLFDEWLRRNYPTLQRVSLANALLAASPMAVGAVSTAYWRWSDPPRFKLFDDEAAARLWCLQRLDRTESQAAGAAPPAPLSMEPAPARLLPIAETLDLFNEPAFLVTPQGEVVFANRAACEAFSETPAWLATIVSTQPSPADPRSPALARLARVGEPGRELFVVIPHEGAALADLPPSLARVARLLSQGLSDKEIANATGLTLRTIRTYVRRLYQRAGVHSRGELIQLWLARG